MINTAAPQKNSRIPRYFFTDSIGITSHMVMSPTFGLLKTPQNPQTAVIRAATVLTFCISKTKFIATIFITAECPQDTQQPSTQFSQKSYGTSHHSQFGQKGL